MRKIISACLALLLCVSLLPVGVSAAGAISRVSRDDGTWLFPTESRYWNSFTDWAGCTGTDTYCSLCGENHVGGWGDPYHGGQGGHNGIDIGAGYGAAVYAAAAGTAYTGYNSARGNYIVIEHWLDNNYSYYSYYQHLSTVAISNGQQVSAGSTIGAVGGTGVGSGVHLHFGIVMAKKGSIINAVGLSSAEGNGWITTAGNRTGRILNNPAAGSMLPTAGGSVIAALKYHAGSVSYTFDANQVSIGKKKEAPPADGSDQKIISVPDGLYVLESKLDSSKAVDVYAGSKDSEANLELWTKNEKLNQKFKIERDGDTYKISAYHSGLSMDVDEASPASGTNIQQYRFWGENNPAQKWIFQDAGDGYVYIRSMLGTYVDVCGGSRNDGTNIWAYNFNGSDAQKWRLVPTSTVSISDGLYVLESKLDSSKAIDVYAGSMNSEANLELWTKNEKNNQKFKIEKDGSTYKITAYHSGLSMDVDEASPASGTNIQQYRFWGENNLAQKWVLQDAGNGYVYIRSMLGTCVDVYDGARADGTNIWAYNFNGTDAQKWKLVPTSCAHTYGNWSVTKSASCTESGTETRVCSLCQKTETRTINALGHSYSNGVCSKCGERENTNTPVTPNPPVTPDSGKKEVHFPKMTVYFQGQFSDVPANQWFTNNVANAFSFGLMKGNSATTFDPYGDVTVAEAIAMAARIHSIYTTGSENFIQGTPWYQCYLDYAYQNKIISYAYYNCDVKHKATRAQFAEIFAAALPDEALSIKNSVSDNAVPDVKMKDSYSAPVYKLYRAGILAGGDAKGTFSPGTFITRAECATIVARMADSDNRVSFSLT